MALTRGEDSRATSAHGFIRGVDERPLVWPRSAVPGPGRRDPVRTRCIPRLVVVVASCPTAGRPSSRSRIHANRVKAHPGRIWSPSGPLPLAQRPRKEAEDALPASAPRAVRGRSECAGCVWLPFPETSPNESIHGSWAADSASPAKRNSWRPPSRSRHCSQRRSHRRRIYRRPD